MYTLTTPAQQASCILHSSCLSLAALNSVSFSRADSLIRSLIFVLLICLFTLFSLFEVVGWLVGCVALAGLGTFLLIFVDFCAAEGRKVVGCECDLRFAMALSLTDWPGTLFYATVRGFSGTLYSIFISLSH